MRHLAIFLLGAAALSACSSEPAPSPTSQPTATAIAAADGATAVALPPTPAQGSAQKVAEANDLFTFNYSWPVEADRIPALRTWLEGERNNARAKVAQEAKTDRDERAKEKFPFHQHDSTIEWLRVTDLPALLSLSVERTGFSGGAHGYYGTGSLVWDKAAAQRLDTIALFRSPDALWQALGKDFCVGLDRARKAKGITPPEGDPGWGCPGLDEVTLIVGSKGGKAIDRIGFLIDPYVAGPWAEGPYEVTLPVTPAIRNAVKERYRGFFAS